MFEFQISYFKLGCESEIKIGYYTSDIAINALKIFRKTFKYPEFQVQNIKISKCLYL